MFAPPPGGGGRSYTLDTANPFRNQLEAEFAKGGTALALACKETCQQLFPQLARFYQNMEYSSGYYLKWRREKCICSPDFFDRYFLLRVPEREISEARMQLILSQSGDPQAIRGQLDQLVQEGKIERFTERLEDLAPSLSHDNTSTLLTALFDVGDSLPSEAKMMLDVSPRLRVASTAYRLLKNQIDSAARLETAMRIVTTTTGLTTLVQFIALIQPAKEPSSVPDASRENLFSEEQFHQLRNIALNRIREEAKTSALSKRPDLAMILFRWKDWDSDTEPRQYVAKLANTDEGLLDLLAGFVTIVRSTTGGSYTVLQIPNIRREHIANFINPDSITGRVESIKANRWSQLSPRQQIAVEAFLNPKVSF
jgi:predicted KAP-like P-loop ATPase